jgi:hypothetical protein
MEFLRRIGTGNCKNSLGTSFIFCVKGQLYPATFTWRDFLAAYFTACTGTIGINVFKSKGIL